MSLDYPPRKNGVDRRSDGSAEPSAEEVLALLDADYTQAILERIRDEPEPARAIADACDASRTTVYRRLNRLEDAGLVESGMTCDPAGHHRTTFETTLESVTLNVTEDGYAISVQTDSSDHATPNPPPAQLSD